jgi:hypothetical protein
MPGAKRTVRGSEGEPTASASPDPEARALVEMLRAVASQIDADPALASRLMAESATKGERGGEPRPSSSAKRAVVAPPLDLFAVLRQSSERGLREALAMLDLVALKAILRAYRLDPARIAARWTAPERIIELIVEQAQARLNHGRAFERV